VKRLKNVYALSIVLFLSFQLSAQEPWELVKENDGIQVFTRKNPGMSFKEFRAVMQMESSIEDFLSVMYDIESLPVWGHDMKEAKLIDRPDESRQTYYAVAKAPWPYKDRDAVYSNIFSWDKTTKTLEVGIEILKRENNTESDYVPMGGYGYWQVREISPNEIEVILQMQVDPGGAIKAWMANMFVTDSPFYTLKGLREAVKDPKYQGNTYDLVGK